MDIDDVDIESILKMRAHQPSGPVYKALHKQLALLNLKENELKGICSITESHAPTMRIKTTYRYDKMSQVSNNEHRSMDKKHMAFNCPRSLSDEVDLMLHKIHEMPKEWTIVQLTSQYKVHESYQADMMACDTQPLHVTVFNCGQREMDPFSVTVPAPRDASGNVVPLCAEMRAIIEGNKSVFHTYIGNMPVEKITANQKRLYADNRNLINERLKNVVRLLEKSWLAEWRCLLAGKLADSQFETSITDRIKETLEQSTADSDNTDNNIWTAEKVTYIVMKLMLCSEQISLGAQARVLQQCVPHKPTRANLAKLIAELAGQHNNFKQAARLPVMLIVDEQLDCFSWEMMDVLRDQPVSRMPSLHFAYALFKEHESTIRGGFKMVRPERGTYVINPGLDLKKMEARLTSFFQHWLPQWQGLAGVRPTSDQFGQLLAEADIFVYNGHGSGTQFLSGNKIQLLRVEGVVLLFGCSSVRMLSTGPHVEMTDVFHNYLIACSPCVLGMLWEVTDFDTDVFSTGLLSSWLPSEAKPHWSQVDKAQWQKGTVVPNKKSALLHNRPDLTEQEVHACEPELLRALNVARRAPTQYLTKSALVARGLPVKLLMPTTR